MNTTFSPARRRKNPRELRKSGITGARWGLDGAEAILKLRAIRANGDFDDYWRFHLDQEHQRVHQARYAAKTIPPPT